MGVRVSRPDAILLDMDDTLVDATSSYRRATIETAASYGVDLTLADVSRAKARGDANDDWALTHRLIAEAGVAVPLAEVTARFEEFYQGRDGRPGLRAAETLLVSKTVLERLSEAVRLGIVTGRPRRDALRLLDEHGIAALFGAVVTMDDGPLKPDPAPVRLALERLDARTAWMVGDTPDDMRAARAAGIAAFGVVAPSDDPSVARPALIAAGAQRILGSLDELLDLIGTTD